mmetsp:Transcript_109356/g.316079  ORF Transcript_109356/g.316079 Transcript_109356/m.316079 type:complete len:218 (-) Transcript_109356:263-916(-)
MGAVGSVCISPEIVPECKACVGQPALWADHLAYEVLSRKHAHAEEDEDPNQAFANCCLQKAARDGDIEGIEQALRVGAYLETRRPFVMAPRSIPQSEQLESTTRDIGMTSLMYAAQGGHADACRLLLSIGAQANAEDEDGQRPLHFAAATGNEEICRALLEWGAEGDALDDDGHDALHYLPPACIATASDRSRWTSLLRRGAEPKQLEREEPPNGSA